MGWWNIDILYQMFKNGVVYHRAPDHGIPGGRYPPGTNKGLTQDQSHIQYKEKAKAKYGTPARIRKAKPTKPAKSSTRIRKARSTKPAMTQKEKVRQQVNRYVERQIQIIRNSQVVDDLERVNFRETLNALQTENVPNEVIQYYIQSIQPLLKAKEEELQKKEKELYGKILREIKRLQKLEEFEAVSIKIDNAELSQGSKKTLRSDLNKKYLELNPADDESEGNDDAVSPENTKEREMESEQLSLSLEISNLKKEIREVDKKLKKVNDEIMKVDTEIQDLTRSGNPNELLEAEEEKSNLELKEEQLTKKKQALEARRQDKQADYDSKFGSVPNRFITDDLHPFVMKPAAPQLHMQKLHMQTSMEKLDLEPAMETAPDDVHVQAVQPMKCGKDMKVEPVACAKHETEHAHGDMKCKHEHSEGMLDGLGDLVKAGKDIFGGKKKKKPKGKKLIADPQQCDSCGELHDGDHDCEVEAFEAMLDGYDSEGLTLEKPRCASVGLANRKLNELH